jgi:hypothetical protein
VDVKKISNRFEPKEKEKEHQVQVK